MRGILVLENSLINKIAAGEVVERPASVVKELVENALDAGATSVTVEIKEGGLSFIRVADNGCGIPADQVKTAFLRHATSKIQSLEDLENVASMGFRGEALASVAAVAQVEMTTKTEEAAAGILLEINGGAVEREEETGRARGTTVTVRNLFYNTPARRKFLKKPGVEGAAVSEFVHKLAIGRPDVAFTYVNNGGAALRTKGKGDLKNLLLQLYGADTVKNLISLSGRGDGPLITGYAGKPAICRGNRGRQHFFLNGRCVKSELVRRAAENAYKTLLMQGKFPFYVIFMALDPELVDVNVHPAKLEVRFAREDEAYEAVFRAVAAALAENSLIPETTLPENRQATTARSRTAAVHRSAMEAIYGGGEREGGAALREDRAGYYEPPREPGNAPAPAMSADSLAASRFTPKDKPPSPPPVETNAANEPGRPREKPRAPMDYRIIGQAFGTYWLVERGGALLVVDQHAAHERVLYEEVLRNAGSAGTSGQMLLQPVVLRLTEREMVVFEENRALFEEFGFDVECFGDDTYALRAVPNIVKGAPDAGFFTEILDKLSEVGGQVSGVHEMKLDAIAMIACKAAVKANDMLTFTEARALIERLMGLERPYTCPHGRPTIIELTKAEFEKKFKRV